MVDEKTPNPWTRRLAIGSALVTGAVIIAPYVLPYLGIGTPDIADEAYKGTHGQGFGSGLAGAVNSLVNEIPLIGPELATNGLTAAFASGAIGLSGVLLGHKIEKSNPNPKGLNWGKIVTGAALATSALIALPSILTGITIGIAYLATVIMGPATASNLLGPLSHTTGALNASNVTSGLGGLTLAAHLLDCCAPILPAAVASRLHNHDTHKTSGSKNADDALKAEVKMTQPAEAGIPCHGLLKLTRMDGDTVKPFELAVVHEQKVHMFVADQSLRDYHHIHPVPLPDGSGYMFNFTPRTNNKYKVWTDITLAADKTNHKLLCSVPTKKNRNINPAIKTNNSAFLGNMNFIFETPEPLQSGKPNIAEITVMDANGKPVTDLEPVMGAYAHLVGFGDDGQSMVHTHPMGATPKNEMDRGGPKMRFHIETDMVGPVQFYVQIKRAGQEMYVPFGQRIKPAPSLLEQVATPSQGTASYVM